MLAKIEVSLVCLALALAGCSNRTSMSVGDAGAARDGVVMPDSLANDDVFMARDVLVPEDVLPDLVVAPDLAVLPDVPADGMNSRREAAFEAGPEIVATPDGAPDSAVRDAQFDMSLCLHVEEPPDSPHSIIHTLDLYAPHVLTTY